MRKHPPIETGSLWSNRQRDAHPLHEVSYRACFKPALAAYFIDRFTSPGDTVLDPFMGRGTTLLEAALRGRRAAGGDANPLGEMLVSPRLSPPPLADVAIWLSRFDWDRGIQTPAELLTFYHPETLRRICLLREAFLGKHLDPVEFWVRMVALNRLTGHSPGFFSVRTLPPNQAISLAAQRALNARHNLNPPLRDVAALILKKSRSLLRHPLPTSMTPSAHHTLWTGHAEMPGPLAEGSVTLAVTSPPFLNVVDYRRDNWLRCWFAGIESEAVPHCSGSICSWETMLTAALAEMRRCLGSCGHAAVEVGEVRRGSIRLEDHVIACGQSAGLVPIRILIHSHAFTKTSRCWGIANNQAGTNTHRVVLFQKQ